MADIEYNSVFIAIINQIDSDNIMPKM